MRPVGTRSAHSFYMRASAWTFFTEHREAFVLISTHPRVLRYLHFFICPSIESTNILAARAGSWGPC